MRLSPSDPERFSKLAAGMQSLVTTAGIVVAGVWILYTFWALGSTNKSRAEIAELEQRAFEQPVLTTQIKPTVSGTGADGQRFITVEVVLRNDGKRALEFEEPVVQVSRLTVTDGDMKMEGPVARVKAILVSARGREEPMPPRLLRSGQGRTIAFLVPVSAVGNYLIQFRTTYAGRKLVDGKFEPSTDEVIDAVEQSILNVSSRETVERATPNPVLQRTP